MKEEISVHVMRDPFSLSQTIGLLFAKYEDRKCYKMVPQWEEVSAGDTMRNIDCIQLTEESAQCMIHLLSTLGVRLPGESTVGQITAIDKHLQDMRVLAFTAHKLEVPK